MITNFGLDVVESTSMRVSIVYNTASNNHVVSWAYDPDETGWTFSKSGEVSVGELRHALAVAAIVVESISKGGALPTEEMLEGFDMKWDVFTGVLCPI